MSQGDVAMKMNLGGCVIFAPGMVLLALCLLRAAPLAEALGQEKRPAVSYPPALPGMQQSVTDKSDELLKPPATLKKDVAVAKTPPTVEFLYYPGQTYAGNPWS